MPEPRRDTCPPHITVSRIGRACGVNGLPVIDADPSIAGMRLWCDVGLCVDCGSLVAATTLRHPSQGRVLIMPMTALVEVSGGELR